MIADTLRRYIREKVWCTPVSDYHAIFKPERVSRKNGNITSISLSDGRVTYALPDKKSNWHVYVIGALPQNVIGLSDNKIARWIPVSQLMKDDRVVINLYTRLGIQLPRFKSYITFTRSGNIILAVPRLNGLMDLNEHDLYVRFYSNRYFESSEWNNPTAIDCFGLDVTSADKRTEFQIKYSALKALGYGGLYCIVDGVMIKNPSQLTVPDGSWVELLFDGSIDTIVRISSDQVHAFESEIDSQFKYLLHIPKDIGGPIHFKDDIDVLLFKEVGPNLQEGVYYHQNVERHQGVPSIRTVTGKDYSIPTLYIDDYIDNLPMFEEIEDVQYDVVLRKTFDNPDGSYDINRVSELYRLDDESIINILTEKTMAVPVWTARHLEKSEYNTLLRSRTVTTDDVTIEKALGYSAISRLVNDSPVIAVQDGGVNVVDIPPASIENSVCILHNQDGTLNSIGSHLRLTKVAVPDSVRLAEVYPGKIDSQKASIHVDLKYVEIEKGSGFRCFKSTIVSGDPQYDWVVAEEGVDYQLNDKGDMVEVEWLVSLAANYVAVVDDRYYTTYELLLESGKDHLDFNITQKFFNRDGLRNDVLNLVPGNLRVWLNGKELVPTIGYHVKWPRIVINDVKHYDPALTQQRVQIMMHGYSDNPTEFVPDGEIGFVTYGQLSWNSRYDIHDNKVLYVNVDGVLHHRDDFVFDEDKEGNYLTGLTNGLPYHIDTPIMTLPMVSGDPMVLRKEGKELNAQIATYLDNTLPKDEIDVPSFIPNNYYVVSPFFSRILFDLINGDFLYNIPDEVTDTWLQNVLLPYKYLLHHDPAYLGFNEDIVTIVPHARDTVDVTPEQWVMMNRINHVFLNKKVKTRDGLRIVGG